MKKIDSHLHFWRYDPKEYTWISEQMPQLRQDRLPEHLRMELEQHGFHGCVAIQAHQTEEETEFLLELSRQHSFVKAVVGWVDLQDEDLEQRLSHYCRLKVLKGFRHIVQDEPDDEFLLRADVIRGVELLKDFGFTYDILVYEKHLPVVVRFLEQLPDQPFVLDHIGKPVMEGGPSKAWKENIQLIAQHPNVFCKLSGLVTEADWDNWTTEDFLPFLEVVWKAFGPERLMIGSDWPVCLLAAKDYGEVIHVVDAFMEGCTLEEKEAVYGENAIRFYHIT
jgi:L-fuconolactonase